ncbi:GNAT family N-acetyltransferase [Bradyrhizobium sp. 177]|uniref:GNAT family N-acetyltransferase n=1 Tax=Bradyrhizobium sp. 177 TaxID=2782647 RepID=UPI001FFA76FC|nr:GNAT family N-acetyltransferase [Bradyrhizobium sp. 177]MCK1552321.1 GNAT family N-acetyltransferase [Bradyrhizobium sp. 177]
MAAWEYRRLASPDDLVGLNWEQHSNLGLFYNRCYLRSFFSSLSADPKLIVGMNSTGGASSVVPAYKTRESTYDYFHPGRLLHALLMRVGRYDLAAASEPLLSRDYFVAAIPFGYTSPFLAVSGDQIDAALDALEKEARADGVLNLACLYYSQAESLLNETLIKRGYLTTILESNGVIEIDPAWMSLDDYFAQLGRRRLRRERLTFCNRGYRCEWHSQLTEGLINTAVQLEAMLLKRKGTNLAESELRDWYLMVRDSLPQSYVVIEVTRTDGSPVAIALFLKNNRTLIGKAIGIKDDRHDHIYFNIAYYEPIKYAIEHDFRAIDYGPASHGVKRRRGAKPEPLYGAFKFQPHTAFVDLWQTISLALGQAQSNAWGRSKDN